MATSRGWVEEQGERARVDDLVRRHGAAADGRPAVLGLEVVGRAGGGIVGHELERPALAESRRTQRRARWPWTSSAALGLIGGDAGGGAAAAADGDAGALERAADGAHDVLVELGDLGDGVSGDDDAVVAHEGDAWRRATGAGRRGPRAARGSCAPGAGPGRCRAPTGHRRRRGRVMSSSPLRLQVTALGTMACVWSTKRLRQQRVEHQLHRRAAALGLGHAHLGGGPHDRVGSAGEAGLVLLAAAVEQQLEQGSGRERHEVVSLDRAPARRRWA